MKGMGRYLVCLLVLEVIFCIMLKGFVDVEWVRELSSEMNCVFGVLIGSNVFVIVLIVWF